MACCKCPPHWSIHATRNYYDMTTCECVQIKYVVELASALAKHPAVYRVDLLTRLIKDPKVAKEYGQEEECILKPEGAENDLGGAYIVRLPCGPVDQYIRYAAPVMSGV